MTNEQWKIANAGGFYREEFVSPDTGEEWTDMRLIIFDIALRKHLGIPIIIASGCRTPAYNKSVGGVENSTHKDGEGEDIRCYNGIAKAKIVEFAIRYDCGIKIMGIGVAKTFVHLDIGRRRKELTMWSY